MTLCGCYEGEIQCICIHWLSRVYVYADTWYSWPNRCILCIPIHMWIVHNLMKGFHYAVIR